VRYGNFCRLTQKGAFVTLVISGVTGPIFIVFVQNVANIWRYCKPLSNAALPNERIHPNLAKKSVVMATSLEESDKYIC